MSIEFRVPIMFSFTTLLICLLLDSAVFQLLPRYYEKVRLLKFLQNRLVLFGLVGPYHYWRTPDLPGTLHLPYARSPCPTPPADPALSRFTTTHCCLRWRHATSTSSMFILTRFYSFTLSHYGSQAPLSTLKPSFTASAPRLSTGCLLDFTGTGLSPACICSAELAHCLYILNQRSPPNDSLRLVN